jgi:hypothetical protein
LTVEAARRERKLDEVREVPLVLVTGDLALAGEMVRALAQNRDAPGAELGGGGLLLW